MILALGICNFLLIFFQVATGLRWVKVPFTVHKKIGFILIALAFIHGLIAILTG